MNTRVLIGVALVGCGISLLGYRAGYRRGLNDGASGADEIMRRSYLTSRLQDAAISALIAQLESKRFEREHTITVNPDG